MTGGLLDGHPPLPLPHTAQLHFQPHLCFFDVNNQAGCRRGTRHPLKAALNWPPAPADGRMQPTLCPCLLWLRSESHTGFPVPQQCCSQSTAHGYCLPRNTLIPSFSSPFSTGLFFLSSIKYVFSSHCLLASFQRTQTEARRRPLGSHS